MVKTIAKSKFVSIILALTTLISVFSAFSLPASAVATYDCMQTRTFIVKTQRVGWYETDPYIVFSCESDAPRGIYHPAPLMSLKIVNKTTGEISWARISGCGRYISSKLKLDGGCKYEITVSYLYNAKENKEKLAVATGLTWNTGRYSIKSTSKLTYTIK